MSWRDRLLLCLIVFGPGTALSVAWHLQKPALDEPNAQAVNGRAVALQTQGATERPFSIAAHRYAFDPPRIEVFEGDLVKIDLHTLDIAHSFTIDGYRISKRVGPDQPVSFEFRAERSGVFPIYCSLDIDEGCRRMHGELVVKPRQ